VIGELMKVATKLICRLKAATELNDANTELAISRADVAHHSAKSNLCTVHATMPLNFQTSCLDSAARSNHQCMVNDNASTFRSS
jgi:hypothetical protein